MFLAETSNASLGNNLEMSSMFPDVLRYPKDNNSLLEFLSIKTKENQQTLAVASWTVLHRHPKFRQGG